MWGPTASQWRGQGPGHGAEPSPAGALTWASTLTVLSSGLCDTKPGQQPCSSMLMGGRPGAGLWPPGRQVTTACCWPLQGPGTHQAAPHTCTCPALGSQTAGSGPDSVSQLSQVSLGGGNQGNVWGCSSTLQTPSQGSLRSRLAPQITGQTVNGVQGGGACGRQAHTTTRERKRPGPRRASAPYWTHSQARCATRTAFPRSPWDPKHKASGPQEGPSSAATAGKPGGPDWGQPAPSDKPGHRAPTQGPRPRSPPPGGHGPPAPGSPASRPHATLPILGSLGKEDRPR